ncbi:MULTISPECIES: 23S rRNA (pseudouridine(1915)-N(3))-methyltransferase RlmH [unclassified Lentimicrobium]|uniref:23S rRNA (pseudouridine(1915)-N(3))-methyltransferase RlmH n=1 Tax=unclassified Lentimicrobium TaxID=2677434 RepID=UPI001554D9AC|nr:MULTISPECIES: 23S rRNA (pseudouridine(1915)-N(3))-methyltransferase RlmH [unclassified Lentimicrobium]NPD45012.1 23S rRNA (pseudouridine(1915)-N(3))-methyltransferase RlmH [Lentimicrobium sp. S6]NPD83535.1 23S rRNA (pseudouridine(1915)-N(3))-methyltransferase RlmH [Lentimicrobium sp. L6]
MRISLMLVGKTTDSIVEKGIEKYLKRMKRYIQFKLDIIPALKNTKNMNEAEIKLKEGELILNKLNPSDFLVLLDENGKEMTSVQFASFVEKSMLQSIKNLVFVVGGAYGFSDAVYKKANQKIALSQMTFSHQIIRMIFLEQIYRAFTIINKEPYHHE